MRKDHLTYNLLHDTDFTQDQEIESIVICVEGKVSFVLNDTDQKIQVPCTVGVYADTTPTGTLEVEIHGSLDGKNWTELVQVVAAKASNGTWEFYYPELKYMPFYKFKFLENDVSTMTSVECNASFG